MNYYNEIDRGSAAWLRELVKQGHIAPGDVDERSIEDVTPNDLLGYRQCHFFAGIGVWSYALRQAGWPDDKPVWTGSCPCQPFSTAGKGAGFADERHLWPAWQWLIQQCRPAAIFGEQVASKATEPWIDLVHADLEAMGYAFGCVPFPSAGVGAPHIRDRAYWVAQSDCERGRGGARIAGQAGGVADAEYHEQWEGRRPRSEDSAGDESRSESCGRGMAGARPGPTNGHWMAADWLFCRDGQWRPVEPGTFPLAHGAPARVGRLRGFGNSIVAQAAHAFIEAYLEQARKR